MKIGIITQPLHTNYGGLLQNYALQQVLKGWGHNVITLDQKNVLLPKWRIYASFIKTFLFKIIGKGNERNYPYSLNKREQAYIRQHTNRFINKYINHTEPFQKIKDFRNYTINNNLDALIVGSDQVWRPIYNRNVLCSFFDFSKGLQVKRIAYAASFGVSHWEFNKSQTKHCRELIRNFNGVSVREDSGIDLCRKYLYCDALHVLDPTMLLEKEDYIHLVEEENEPISKGNLFTYILDNSIEKKSIVDEVASELSLIPFAVFPKSKASRKTIKRNLDACVYPSVTQWLRAFVDAEFVVCDSFHGAVFSIIFNKPFLIIGNKGRGMARFNALLEMFDLKNRMVNDIADIHSIVNTLIDWDKINQIRLKMKIYSLEYLTKNLIQ